MSNFEVPAFFLGAIMATCIFIIVAKFREDSLMYKKYAECVDSVKIPVGECSRLFREEK
jgi:hypothetical protein